MSVRADQRSESSLLFYKIARELRREISCDLLNKFNSKDEGELDRKQIAEFYSSWRGFMQYFDSKTLLKNTDKLYNKLFIEG